jgi:hypothetical protein
MHSRIQPRYTLLLSSVPTHRTKARTLQQPTHSTTWQSQGIQRCMQTMVALDTKRLKRAHEQFCSQVSWPQPNNPVCHMPRLVRKHSGLQNLGKHQEQRSKGHTATVQQMLFPPPRSPQLHG